MQPEQRFSMILPFQKNETKQERIPKYEKIITFIHGFCMALADSVPGVSGGTVAFLLGFMTVLLTLWTTWFPAQRKANCCTALPHQAGHWLGHWFSLSSSGTGKRLWKSHLLDFLAVYGLYSFRHSGRYPGRKQCLKEQISRIFFVLIGIAVVSVITYLTSSGDGANISLTHPNVGTFLYVFVCGAIAICAMVLPGISGSTLLLIFGIYVPIITAIKDFLHLNFSAFPTVFVFGLGVLTGIVAIIKIIRNALISIGQQRFTWLLAWWLGHCMPLWWGQPHWIPCSRISPFTHSAFYFSWLAEWSLLECRQWKTFWAKRCLTSRYQIQ